MTVKLLVFFSEILNWNARFLRETSLKKLENSQPDATFSRQKLK